MTELRKATALKLRSFLGAPDGIELIAYLRATQPSIAGADSTAIIMAAGINQGYTRCVDKLLEIAEADDKKKVLDENLLNKGLE